MQDKHESLEDDGSTSQNLSTPDLSVLLITLLKSVIYRENNERLWSKLLNLQPQVREYASILNLELMIDEAEGYAFLKGRAGKEQDSTTSQIPRLVARRPLSFSVSLLVALLRKKLAEFDASGTDTRLVMDRDAIVELVRVFMPDGSNEVRLIDQIEASINKVVELGFLHRLKPAQGMGHGHQGHYEVRRILKAFVDAQWLSDMDQRLESYKAHLNGPSPQESQDHV